MLTCTKPEMVALLGEFIRSTSDARELKRALAVKMAIEGKPYREIAADTQPKADFADFLAVVEHAQTVLGQKAVPIILSPVTLLCLSRVEGDLMTHLHRLLPLYRELLAQLAVRGITEVQCHEPILVTSQALAVREAVVTTYTQLALVGVPIQVMTYFDDLGDAYPWVVALPVAGIGLDFTRGRNLEFGNFK